MTDIFTPEKRSWVMSRIRSKNTGIERTMCSLFRKHGLHYRRHPKIFGSPDFIVEKSVLVFCDGDFWHGYKYYNKKKMTKKFWREKIEGNIKRDKMTNRLLRSGGYSVLRLWEHDINGNPEKCIRKIRRGLRFE
tara:strand:+ start:126 stop:527 length:402 start_codon:yes stop_codon:yes gene_type:complete